MKRIDNQGTYLIWLKKVSIQAWIGRVSLSFLFVERENTYFEIIRPASWR